MKSIKIIGALVDRALSFKARPWKVCLAILLTGAIVLMEGSDPRFQAGATSIAKNDELTMEKYAQMGRVIVFGSALPVPGKKSIGKGQCPLCHTFEPGDNIGRCPNLFGVADRSHTRIKENRYRNEPIKIGETDKASRIVKGRPDLIPEGYRREGSPEMTGEDYLRESMLCPSCYVVKGYGKVGDTISPEPMFHKPPISLNRLELNAVIAWLQSKDKSGSIEWITVPLPKSDELAPKPKPSDENRYGPTPHDFGQRPVTVEKMVSMLGCSLCHTIPGVEGAVGVLGPPLHQKIDAPKRIRDPRYKGKARTTHEYVKESILDPDAYIVLKKDGGPYPAGVMPRNYGNQLSPRALEVLVDFIANTEPAEKK